MNESAVNTVPPIFLVDFLAPHPLMASRNDWMLCIISKLLQTTTRDDGPLRFWIPMFWRSWTRVFWSTNFHFASLALSAAHSSFCLNRSSMPASRREYIFELFFLVAAVSGKDEGCFGTIRTWSRTNKCGFSRCVDVLASGFIDKGCLVLFFFPLDWQIYGTVLLFVPE